MEGGDVRFWAAGRAGEAAGRPQGERALRALHAYMQSHLCAPLGLDDLARAAGVSLRSLNTLCQRAHGLPPMALLRQLRLEAARRQLKSHPGRSVTEVALDCGFTHLGRFAAYYRQRFGELPAQR